MSDIINETSIEIEWPRYNGPLYLYQTIPPEGGSGKTARLHLATVASPLTTTDAATLRWRDITYGVGDYEDSRTWGTTADDRYAHAIACTQWADGSFSDPPEIHNDDNDSGESEEWHCRKPVFLRSDGKRQTTAPRPQFAEALKAGPITTGVALVRPPSRRQFQCSKARAQEDLATTPNAIATEDVGDEVSNDFSDVPAIAWLHARSPSQYARDQFFAYRLRPGGRLATTTRLAVEAFIGCAHDPALSGEIVPGPAGLFGYRPNDRNVVMDAPTAPYRIFLDAPTHPLRNAKGEDFSAADLVWTAPPQATATPRLP